MKENYEAALAHVLVHEGGYVDHPRDPGGATNKGVIQRTYNGYRRRVGKPLRSVRHLTELELREIYKTQYWDMVHGDELPHGVDYCTFDAAVNSGPGRAAKWLQRSIVAKADGRIGNETLGKLRTVDASVIINRMCDDRMNFLHRLGHWPTFRKGWTRRIKSVRSVSLQWAQKSTKQLVAIDRKADAPPESISKPIAGVVATCGGVIATTNRLAPEWLLWAIGGGLTVGLAIILLLIWRARK